ncbi:MAG: Ig-like domain-containing protein [Pirellulaceae bacterium]|jgi:hypothetical protein|nr:Ig-like domain-containing protein [Pirellulaceae bacterium]
MLNNFFSPRQLARRQRRRRRPLDRRTLTFETCEDRRLLAVLGVTIDRDQVLEFNGNGAANATIVRDDTIGELTVSLSSDDTSEMTVQPSVTMASGVGSAVVPLNVVDDALLDGLQTVTITASASGFTSGSDTIDVRDIETLSLAVADESIANGGATTATLARSNTDVAAPLLVNIQDEHAADLVIPSQVEIPSGQQSVQFSISTLDDGIVDGTRTIQLVVFTDGYLNGSDTLEITESDITGVDAAADGYAIDIDQDGSFSRIVTTGYSDQSRAAASERRALFEFDVSNINSAVDQATLTLRVQGYSASQGVGPTVEFFGYVGDGSLSSADATAGQKVGEFLVPGSDGVRRYAVPLDLAWLQPLVGVADHLGFSARIADGSNVSFTSSRNTFSHESNHPMLQFSLASQPSPTAVDDAAATDEDAATPIAVLNNDFGTELTVTGVTDPAHGTAVINNDQTVTYTPAANFFGDDSFSYSIRDASGDTDQGTVEVTVKPINDSPVGRNDVVSTNEDQPVTVDVLDNDLDVDGDTLSIDRLTQPAHGTAVVNNDNTVTYTPDADYFGADSLVYSATDGNGGFSRAFVNISVAAVNDDPTVVDAVFAIEENSPVGLELGQISAADIDGDELAFALAGEDAAAFAIDSATGVLSVADAALLDYETQSRFDFDVAVTDATEAPQREVFELT